MNEPYCTRRSFLRYASAGIAGSPAGHWALLKINPTFEMLPKRYHRVILRLDPKGENLESELRYEGNNRDLRGSVDSHGLYVEDGEEVAERWQKAGRGCAGIFVLRDSLWSQQDHITRQKAYSPLIPPNWITAAALVANGSLQWTPVHTAPVDDDFSWTQIKDPFQLFGSAPKSDSLFRAATYTTAGQNPKELASASQARYAREVLNRFASIMQTLHSTGTSGGVDAVAQIGAEISSQSDRAYFTPELRSKFIPISVTNPRPKEIEEGKGVLAPEHATSLQASEIGRVVSTSLLRRRLEDGDIAIERYDISQSKERALAIKILEDLIPAHSKTGKSSLWLWVNGPLDPTQKLRGEDATKWLAEFQIELQRARIDHARLQIFSKPSVDLPSGAHRKEALERALARSKRMDIPLSLNMRSEAFRNVFK